MLQLFQVNLKGNKMKKFNLATLLLGAMLFMGLGAVSLSAEMKCGAGKCGSSMQEPATKCGGDKAAAKCGAEKKTATKCGGDKAVTKCGGEKQAPKAAAKCGAGKCGSK